MNFKEIKEAVEKKVLILKKKTLSPKEKTQELSNTQNRESNHFTRKVIIPPNSRSYLKNVRIIKRPKDAKITESIPNPTLTRKGYGEYDCIYYGELFDKSWKDFILQIHPGYNVPNEIKTMSRRWKIIVKGQEEEISEDRKNKTITYERHTDYFKEDDKSPYEYPSTVYTAELDTKGKPIMLLFKTKINDDLDSKKQGEYQIKISDASYIPNFAYEDGIKFTYPEEYNNKLKDLYAKPGFYILQEITHKKEGNSETFKVSEHYESVEDLYPKKINISVPEKKQSMQNRSYNYYLTVDGKNYIDEKGVLISLQEIRKIEKEYGFINASEGRLARIYRANHGAKKYINKKYSIIPRTTEKVIRTCESLGEKETENQQEII